jgi:Fe-S-cluster containining protein
MDVKKFNCINCGDCCKSQTSSLSNEYKQGKFTNVICYMLNEQNLSIFDWEKSTYLEKLKEKGSNVKVIPSTVSYDLTNNETIVLFYTQDQNGCPLLNEKKLCEIYEERPSVCRQYPCMQNVSCFIWSPDFKLNGSGCISEKKDGFLTELHNELKNNTTFDLKKLYKIFKERYGDSFYYNLAYEMFIYKAFTLFNELEAKGAIHLVREGADEKETYNKINNSKFVDISEFYLRHKNVDIKKFLNLDYIKNTFDEKFL